MIPEREGEDCTLCEGINKWAKEAQREAFNNPFVRKLSALVHPDSSTNNVAENSIDSTSASYLPFPCPPNVETLGKNTWTFLHTLAAYYPGKPTNEDQKDIQTFFELVARFYPCRSCGDAFIEELKNKPVAGNSDKALSLWLCQMHNEVNERLGKPIFDCSKVLERWKNAGKFSSDECS